MTRIIPGEKLREIGYRLRLTRNEQNVLFFLALVILGGAAVTGGNSLFGNAEHAVFDYDALDREFARASNRDVAADSAARKSDIRSNTRQSGTSLPYASRIAGKINLNTATMEELTALPGVGPVTADRIIEYRSRYGPFQRIEDVTLVKSIGEKKFEKMKEFITVQ